MKAFILFIALYSSAHYLTLFLTAAINTIYAGLEGNRYKDETNVFRSLLLIVACAMWSLFYYLN